MPQKGTYSICVWWSGNFRQGCGGGYVRPTLFMTGPLQDGGEPILKMKNGVMYFLPTNLHSVNNPSRTSHVCCRQISS